MDRLKDKEGGPGRGDRLKDKEGGPGRGERLKDKEGGPGRDGLVDLMFRCWARDPRQRPSFSFIQQQLQIQLQM